MRYNSPFPTTLIEQHHAYLTHSSRSHPTRRRRHPCQSGILPQCRWPNHLLIRWLRPQLTCEIPPPTKPIPVEREPQDCPFGTWNGQWSGNISLFAKGSTHLNCNHHNYAKFQAGSYALPDNQPFKLFNQPGWQCTAQSGSLSCTNTEGHGFQISPDSLYRF